MPLATHATALMRQCAIVLVTTVAVAPQAAHAAPVASFTFSPASPLTAEPVTFTSTSSGVVEPQRWGLDNDRVCDDTAGPSAQRSFATAGSYRITLCVTDGSDQGTQTRTVTVRNRPPVAAFTYAPGAPVSGDPVVLTSISADPDGPIVAHAWDLDRDGAYDDGQASVASITFPAAGDYQVGLVVTDRDGAASVAVKAIHVEAPAAQFINPFPVVRMVGAIGSRGTRIREIVVRVPPAGRVRIRCRGGGCPPVAKPTGGARVSRTLHVRRFARRTLRPGAVVQVWVTKTGAIGKYTRFRIRARRPPSRIDRCLMPGEQRPVRCDS